MRLSYDGTRFHGWQSQSNAPSVQEEIEKALSVITRTETTVVGAGRTDTGVHASCYIAHFDCLTEKMGSESILFRLNCLLPPDIAVQTISPVKPDAHARFDALYREYQYHLSSAKDPFTDRYTTRENRRLDLNHMNMAASVLMGISDFTSFCKLGSDTKTNVCRVTKALWEEREGRLVFTIRADRFLRNMVRAVVGTLLEVGLGKMTQEEFLAVIERKDRGAAGASVPAKGLFLTDIGYPDDIYLT